MGYIATHEYPGNIVSLSQEELLALVIEQQRQITKLPLQLAKVTATIQAPTGWSEAAHLGEEAPQNYHVRRDQIPGVRLRGHHSGDGKAAQQKPMQGTGLPGTLRSFTAYITEKRSD